VVSVEVHDTGPGIPENKHALIFKEFHRLNPGAPSVHGIGLGLSIVERISRMLDHPIHLSSRPGEGSVFAVTLPISTEAVAVQPVTYPSAAQWTYLKGCTVLCVDNEPAILDGMRSLLENWQCKVLQAADSAQALQAMAAEGAVPDVILADYHLEDETGVDCIDRIRKQAGYDIPAMLITADRSPAVEQEARGNSLHLLRKPLKPAALRALITRLYQQRQAAE
jgi:CheY-like chemotaxis protein